MAQEIRRLQLKRPKAGGMVEGIVSIGSVTPYVQVFGNMDEARDFAARFNLELLGPPTENQDEVPQGSQGHTRH